MTKNEFLDYVKTFNKKFGEYTRDEVFDIGLRLKTVEPVRDRDWSLFAQIVGWENGAESLRCYIKDRQKRECVDITKKDKTIDELKQCSYEEEKLELMKLKQRTRDEWNAYRRAMREDSRLDEIKDLLRESISNLEPIDTIRYDKSKYISSSNEAVLLLSDLHIGVECDNFYNKYNIEIAKKRVDKIVNDTIKYCRLNGIVRLNIVNLGDLIHGIIHTSARVEQEVDVIDQITIASEILSNALNELQYAAKEVVYRSVVDNHSRITPNKEESIDNENLSRIIDWYLQERLKNTNIKFANDNIDIGMGKFTLMNGKKIMFSHGHQDTINKSFQNFVGASKEYIDYILLGHYHSEKSKTFNGIKVIVNGSIVGTEQYALSKRLFSSPTQTLLIFEEDNLQNITIDLNKIK